VFLCIFIYFNIEIGILDYYTVECEVHWLVFIIQWNWFNVCLTVHH